MRVFVPEPTIGELDGFTPEVDIFKRAELGASMTHLVKSVSDPMVVALDADWGTGKTVFLKMWAGQLRNAGIHVVYFDAFANDFQSDGFTALATEIIGLAKEKQKKGSKAAQQLKIRAVGVGKVLLRGSAKIAVKAATLGAIDTVDLNEFGKVVSGDIASEALFAQGGKA
jgi:predicted KAP-like P-loop ATPase